MEAELESLAHTQPIKYRMLYRHYVAGAPVIYSSLAGLLKKLDMPALNLQLLEQAGNLKQDDTYFYVDMMGFIRSSSTLTTPYPPQTLADLLTHNLQQALEEAGIL